MEIVSLGDSALIVRVRDQFEEAPEETLYEVLRTFQRIRNAAIPGVIELAPAYTSVSVFFDPITVTKAIETSDDVFGWLATRIRAAVAGVADPGRKVRAASQTIEIPVCYDPEFALDIDDVARRANISPSEIIDRKSKRLNSSHITISY